MAFEENLSRELMYTAEMMTAVTGYLKGSRVLPLPETEENAKFIELLREYEGKAQVLTSACFSVILQPEVSRALLNDTPAKVDFPKIRKTFSYMAKKGQTYPNDFALVLGRYSTHAGIYLETTEPEEIEQKSFAQKSTSLIEVVADCAPVVKMDRNRWVTQRWAIGREREVYVVSLELKPEDLAYNPNLFLHFIGGIGSAFGNLRSKIIDEKMNYPAAS